MLLFLTGSASSPGLIKGLEYVAKQLYLKGPLAAQITM